MTQCTECHTEWTFRDKAGIYKTLHSSKECPYCGAVQFVSLKSKRQGSMLSFLIILVILMPITFNMPILLHIISVLSVIAVVVYLQVMLIRLSGKEEFII